MDLIKGEEIQEFLKKASRVKGPEIITALANYNKDLSYILGNELGKEIFNIDIKRLEELFVKVYKENADQLELAEFRYLRDRRIPLIADKIRAYMDNIKKVKKVVSSK